MRRIVVIGGGGFFGGEIARKLREWSYAPLIAGRSRGDLRLDVEQGSSIRAALRAGDLVLDTAGPFQQRSALLLDCAIEIGFDLIDVSDSYSYAAAVHQRADAIERRGIRVLSSCSALSAASALAVAITKVSSPLRLTAYLAPASRYTANRATVQSMLSSIGRPIPLFRDGTIQEGIGWTEARTLHFPEPAGVRSGFLVESVDALTLPRIWPSLREVEFVVDTQIPGANRALRIAARSALLRCALEWSEPAASGLARLLGPARSILAYEIETASRLAHFVLAGERSYLLAVLPAALAARSILQESFIERGLVPPHRQIDPAELMNEVASEGIVSVCV